MSFELVIDNMAAVEMPLPPIDIIKVKMSELGISVKDFGVALHAELATIGFLEEPAELPLAVYDATKKSLLIYPNIVLPRMDIVKGVVSPKYCDLFSIKFYSEIATDISSRRWDNPENALNRTEETTVARFLTKLLPKGTADNLIRDIAQRLESAFLPTEVLYATTEEAWMEMYSCNCASCMKIDNYTHVLATPGQVAIKRGIWPCLYMYHWPNVTGAYIKKNGAVVARASLFKKNPTDDKFVGFSNPYGVTDVFKALLKKELTKLCPMISFSFSFEGVHTAPAYIIDGVRYALICSCDVVSNALIHVCYDKGRDCIMYGPATLMPAGSKSVEQMHYSNKGFIPLKELYQYDGASNQKAA